MIRTTRLVTRWDEVVRRLRAGERLRTGYTFGWTSLFDNGDEVIDAVLRQHRHELLVDSNGYITLDGPVKTN